MLLCEEALWQLTVLDHVTLVCSVYRFNQAQLYSALVCACPTGLSARPGQRGAWASSENGYLVACMPKQVPLRCRGILYKRIINTDNLFIGNNNFLCVWTYWGSWLLYIVCCYSVLNCRAERSRVDFYQDMCRTVCREFCSTWFR